MNTKIKSSTWLFDNHPYITIIGLGVLLRLVIFILYQHINIYPDSHAYIYLAERLSTFSLKGYIGIRTPGYSLLLMLSSINMTIVVILQNVIGIITSIFLFKILLLINFNKPYALTLTLMSVVYLPSIFFEYCILNESLTLFNIILIFYFLFGIIYSERTGVLNFIILSLLISFLVIIKPFYIFIPFVIVFVLLLHKRDRQSVIRNYTILLILPLFVLTGWCSINYQNTGHFTPTTLYGYNLAQNCVSFAENTDAKYKEIGDVYAKHRKENQDNDKDISMSIWDSYKELKTATNLSFVDLSQLLYDYSLSTIRLNPLKYFKQVGISWLDFWKTSLYWQYDSFTIDNANNILNVICYVERILLQILKIIFVLFIPYNLLKYRISNKYISPQFIISVVALLTSILQALSTYGTNSRFSYPFEILIAVSAVMNIYALWKSVKRIP